MLNTIAIVWTDVWSFIQGAVDFMMDNTLIMFLLASAVGIAVIGGVMSLFTGRR